MNASTDLKTLPKYPFYVAALYALAGVVWVGGGDAVLRMLVADVELRAVLELVKDSVFVGVTAATLYVVLRRLQRRNAAVSASLADAAQACCDLFARSPDPILVIDRQSLGLLAVNPAAEDAYGLSRGQLTQLTLPVLIAEPLATAESLAAAGPMPYTVRHRGRDGRILHFEVVSCDTTFEQRAVRVLICRNVTNRTQFEQELRASRDLLRFTQHLAGFGTMVIDPDAGAIVWSEQALQICGLDPALPGPDVAAILAMLHPEDQPLADQYFARYRQDTQDVLTAEFRLLAPDGSLRYLQVRGRRRYWQADARVRLVVVILDLTERKRIEERLANSEQHYRQLVDQLPDALLLVQMPDQIRYANPAAARLFGATDPERLTGLNMIDLLAQTAPVRFEDLPGAADDTRPCVFARLDGGTFTGGVTVTPYGGAPDGNRYQQLVIRDISDLHRTREALARANARLQRVSSQLIRTDEGVRHRLARELHDDIGQLLTYIAMTAAALARRLAGGDEAGRSLALQGAAREALAKVRNLALLLRPPQLDALGLEPALRAHLERFLADSEIIWQLRCETLEPRPDPEVEIALFRIAQEAVTNTLRHANAGRIDLELHREGDSIELQLIDDGVGFDVERTLAATVTSGVAGMRERAQLLGGSFELHSTPGVGTAVRARLPLQATALPMGVEP